MSNLILEDSIPQLRDDVRDSKGGACLVILACVCSTLLAACSGSAVQDPATIEEEAALAKKAFPLGAAAPLSVVSAGQLPSGSPAETAMNCAVAMRVTNLLVSQQGATIGRDNIALMKSAAIMFRDRAIAAVSGDEARRGVASELEKRSEAAQASKAQQVRIAMGCLRDVPGMR